MTAFGERLSYSVSETDLQLVVGADDLKSIERDIDLFIRNENSVQMIVTSPGPKLTGAIRFGAGNHILLLLITVLVAQRVLNQPWDQSLKNSRLGSSTTNTSS